MSKTNKQATVSQVLLPAAKTHEETCAHCLQLPPLRLNDAISHHNTSQPSPKTKRTASRFRTTGIVVFSIAGKPAVANINDIATGGVSFLYTDEIDVSSNILTMDILIFDSQTKFEYLIPQINGQMTSRISAVAPKCQAQCWRYGVEFVDIDSSKKKFLPEIIQPEIKFHPLVFQS